MDPSEGDPSTCDGLSSDGPATDGLCHAKFRQPIPCLPPAGDQSGNLLWRLQHGETPDSEHQPTAAVILIGTNDLNLAITSVRRGGLGVTDLTPCAVGISDR